MKVRELWMVIFMRDMFEEIFLFVMEVVKKVFFVFGVIYIIIDLVY